MIPSFVRTWFWPFLALGAGLLFFLCPGEASAGVARGLELCGQSVIPALFPYMVITSLLLAAPRASALLSLPLRPLGRLMGQKNADFCTLLLLCALGGFASAAHCIGQAWQEGRLSRRQAWLLCFGGIYASPAFVCNVAGAALGPGAGALLLGCGLAAGLVCCLAAPLFCPLRESPLLAARPKQGQASAPGPTQAVSSAALAMVQICGFVIFFSFLAQVLGSLLPASPLARALVGGVLEMTGGCEASLALPGVFPFYGCRAVLSLLGLCAFCQVDALLPAGLSRRPVYWGRALHLALSLFFLRLCLPLLPQEAPAYSSLAPRLITYHRMEPDAALLLFALCCLVLFRLEKSSRSS